jgi:hypothetical protein
MTPPSAFACGAGRGPDGRRRASILTGIRTPLFADHFMCFAGRLSNARLSLYIRGQVLYYRRSAPAPYAPPAHWREGPTCWRDRRSSVGLADGIDVTDNAAAVVAQLHAQGSGRLCARPGTGEAQRAGETRWQPVQSNGPCRLGDTMRLDKSRANETTIAPRTWLLPTAATRVHHSECEEEHRQTVQRPEHGFEELD